MGFRSRTHLRLLPAFHSCILRCIRRLDVFFQSYANVTANTKYMFEKQKNGEKFILQLKQLKMLFVLNGNVEIVRTIKVLGGNWFYSPGVS